MEAALTFSSPIYFSAKKVAREIAVGAAGSGFWDFIKWLFTSSEEQQKEDNYKELIEIAKKNGMNLSLVDEAAKFYDPLTLLTYIKDGARFWYMFNDASLPVNYFTFSVKNNLYKKTSGQIKFIIIDDTTNSVEMSFYTEVFALDSNDSFAKTYPVTQYPLPNSGLKRVIVTQSIDNCEISVSKLMVLHMSPKI